MKMKYITIMLLQVVIALWLLGGSLANAALQKTHPRLMSTTWIESLTSWSNDSKWGPGQRFQNFADSGFGDSNDASRLFAKALMWRMGKGNVYLTSSLNNFDSVVNGISGINDIASKSIYVAYAYDLLYAQLPVASQKNAIDKFNSWQPIVKANAWVSGRYVFQNYSIEKWVPALIVAAAGANDPSNVTNTLDAEYNYWKTNYFDPALYWVNLVFGGAMQEGTYYGTVVNSKNFLHAADVVSMAEGVDLFNTNSWFQKRLMWEWQAYSIPYKFTDPIGGTGEYGWYYHAWGHSERLRARVPFQARLNILLLNTRVTNNPYRGQIYNYLYENADPDLNSAVYDYSDGGALWAFLYGAKNLASQSTPQALQFWTSNINTSYGPGYAFMRTGYTSNDIYVSFKCGDMLSRAHDNLEEGTFQLWGKGEDLAIHSGAYDGSGEYSQTSDYFSRTVSMNGIIVRDPAQRYFLAGSERDNDGGERSYTNWPQDYSSAGSDVTSAFNNWLTTSYQSNGALNPEGVNHKGRLLKADHRDNEYSYVFCDLTRAYNSDQYIEGKSVNNNPVVSSITRELALVDNKYVVVFDRINKKSASYVDKWLLHTQTSFNVNGALSSPSAGEQLYTNTNGTFATTVKNAKLFGQVVLPDNNYQIRKFNNEKRYWNYVRNVPISAGLWYGLNWGADRLEVEPTDSSLNHNFLVVLYPASAETASMPTTVKVQASTNNMTGAIIKNSTLNQIVMFSSSSTGAAPTGDISYVIRPTVSTRHVLFDMTPNQTYYVTLTPNSPTAGDQQILVTTAAGSGTPYVASSQGVLSFTDYTVSQPPDKTSPASPSNLIVQ